MKKLLIIVLLATTSCITKSNEKLSENYKGYVYNMEKEPLSGVKVYAYVSPLKYTYTNERGYFLLKRRSMGFVDNLVFEKEGYVKDTIVAFTATRRRDKTHFLTKRSDTLFMLKNVKQKSNKSR